MDRFFPAVIGNEKLKRRLGLEIEEDRFPHAYILAGQDGSGKMTLAMNIAAALACESKDALPCGKCESCRKILGGFSPDVLVLRKDADKKEFSVNLIREIKDGLYIAPNELEKRVYIIDGAERMNVSAQNAFLKMLEEPPHYTVFLLLCSNTGNLLDTIKSRAPILYTEAISEGEIRAYLLAHSPRAKELETNDPDRLRSILRSAAGSIGRAIYLCEDAGKYETLQKLTSDFLSVLGTPSLCGIDLLCDAVPTDSDGLCAFLSMLKRALRDIAVFQKAPGCSLLYFEDAAHAEEYAMKFTVAKAVALIEEIDGLLSDLQLNLDARLAATALVAGMRSIMTK